MRSPTTKEFELLALGAIAVGTIYQFSSSPTSLLGVATWNLGGRLLMRCASNYYFSHSKYEHIIVKAWDVPVNVAMTTFLSSGIAPSLVGFELGVKFAQSFAYGVVGGIIKDFASSAVNNFIPACDQKEGDKGKSIPAGKHTTDCLKYFLVQLTKFTLSPLKYNSVLNVAEQSFAGFMRNLMNEVVNAKDAFKDCRDQLIMGAITHPIYLAVPPMIFSSSTFMAKCAFGIVVDSIERVAYHISNDKPFTTLVSQIIPSGKEKTA
jgi:hypothetical protein